MELIDYGKLETIIVKMEQILAEFDIEERQLVLKVVHQRVLGEMAKQRSNDLMNQLPLGGLMKRFMKESDKGEE